MTVRGLAGVVLAAGAGTRLAPLTELMPKALCPVANRPLVDHALERLRPHVGGIAVNVHHHRDRMLAYLDQRAVHVSIEEEVALGTAGGLANLAGWLDGRGALVLNADAWGTDPLERLVADWDGATVRLLVTPAAHEPDFDGLWRFAGASLTPWADIRGLEVAPGGLYEVLWSRVRREGRLELVPSLGVEIDCGTPRDYLAANLTASGGASVIGEGATVDGSVEAAVVWPGARVGADEHLRHAIRLPDGRTVAARGSGRAGDRVPEPPGPDPEAPST